MRRKLSSVVMDRIAVAIGVLDVVVAVCSLFGLLVLVGWYQLWLNHINFGSAYPKVWAGLEVMASALILVPGVIMLLRKKTLAWVNYLFAPLRLVFLPPTVLPLSILLGALGIRLPIVLAIGLGVGVEIARCYFVYIWFRQPPAPGRLQTEALSRAA